MRSTEPGVFESSDYYLYTPSTQAVKTFFYPVCTGYFRYAPGYCLKRNSYDSFLIMYIKKGCCTVKLDSQTYTAGAGHKFDKYLSKIYQLFRENASIKEALVSQYITNVLTALLVSRESHAGGTVQSEVIEETTAYMSEHMTEPLTLEQLAARASLSPYYFTRLFKKETGFTPHEYLIAIRINAAKFLLKNVPATSIKEVCFRTGFSNESSFCTTFKKWVGSTPSEYRQSS